MARNTQHGERTRRMDFTISESNWWWLQTNTEASNNRSALIDRLITSYRITKEDNIDEVQLIIEKEQLEATLRQTQDRLQQLTAQLVKLTDSKRKLTEEETKKQKEEEKKKYCKNCGILLSVRFDKIGSVQYQYCHTCWIESQDFKNLLTNRNKQITAKVDNG